MLHRMVQQLGTGRDTSELRNQCQHQLQVVDELRGKIHAQVCVYLHTVVRHAALHSCVRSRGRCLLCTKDSFFECYEVLSLPHVFLLSPFRPPTFVRPPLSCFLLSPSRLFCNSLVLVKRRFEIDLLHFPARTLDGESMRPPPTPSAPLIVCCISSAAGYMPAPRAPPRVVPSSYALLNANNVGADAGFPVRLFQLQLQQQQAETASRQEAARLGAMNSKLTKDFNRVNAVALDLGAQVRVGPRAVGRESFGCLPRVARLEVWGIG